MEKSRIEALVREVEKATEELGIYPAPAPALTPETVAKIVDAKRVTSAAEIL